MSTPDAFLAMPDLSRPSPDLGALYAPPSPHVVKGVLDRLIDFHLAYLKVATFFVLSTGSEKGLDASPRGGPAGFVKVIDEKHVAFADWPGNNKIESMRNLQLDDRLGMLFLFPGLELFMRINGRGRISTDPALLAQLAEGERAPKTAIVVAIDEVFAHCGKAVNRAKLWAAESKIDRGAVPSVGQLVARISQLDQTEVAAIDARYDQAVRHDLY